jgi:ubiquinone/menaquinone biosynthesis C-methylase UbiE
MINSFDERALTWDDNPQFVERSIVFAEKIREQVSLRPDMEGYEYGCGTGLLSFNLMPYLKHITLADSSDGMLEVLRQKIAKHGVSTMDVIKSDLAVDEIPEKKFDIIYTALALHHVSDVETILAKFYAMLKSSGYLCVADLDTEDGSFHGPEFTGQLGFDREALKKLFERAGFTGIKVSTCHKIVRTNEQNETRTYPLFLMTGMKA